MIARVWHGWTAPEHADGYERFLRESVLSGLFDRVRGFRGGYVLRREGGTEVEFSVVTIFDSLASVRDFAGDDYEVPVIEPDARRLLRRGDARARHYEIVAADLR